ncbi:putative cytochrome P450 superfamily protein isoform X4 [Iris pallida]|uniref:Cytochrome P450 superfamily protein isoform X4 n=1 Tax=Iris pallida TaxID=29817 RepID=A0AAX6F7L7_IRIPA|nr:putative cytochrome P450 superfamily protein isoform X4 [Iris pallida]
MWRKRGKGTGGSHRGGCSPLLPCSRRRRMGGVAEELKHGFEAEELGKRLHEGHSEDRHRRARLMVVRRRRRQTGNKSERKRHHDARETANGRDRRRRRPTPLDLAGEDEAALVEARVDADLMDLEVLSTAALWRWWSGRLGGDDRWRWEVGVDGSGV